MFRTKSWSESINFSQSQGCQFSLQLTRNGKVGFLSKEILFVINLSIFGSRKMIQIKTGHLKSFARPFRIRAGNKRCMDVIKPAFVKTRMDSINLLMPDS